MTSDPLPDRSQLDDNVRRTVERTALRKVRNVLDAVEREEQSEQRLRRIVYVVSGILALLLIWFVIELTAH